MRPRAVDRAAAAAVGLSLLSLPFLLPHVLEDFQLGIAERVGLTPPVGAALLGAGLAVQAWGLVLAGQGRRAGLVLTALAGAVWAAGALWDHGAELYQRGAEFRSSSLSTLWVVGLALTQGLACTLALVALARGGPWQGRGGDAAEAGRWPR